MEKRSMGVGTWELTEEQRAALEQRAKLAELTVTAATAAMTEILQRINRDGEKMEACELREMAEAINRIATAVYPTPSYMAI